MHNLGVIRPSFGRMVRYSLTRIWYPLWLLPIVIVGTLLPLHINGIVKLSKSFSEPVAPAILAIACIVATVRWYKNRRLFLLWLAALLAVFFTRELHFAGTSEFVYFGFIGLMFIAWHQYPRLGDHLGSRLFMTLFSSTLFSYMVAVGLDNHWWKFLPGDKYQWAQVEEFVEICGHLLLLCLAISAKPENNPLITSEKPD